MREHLASTFVLKNKKTFKTFGLAEKVYEKGNLIPDYIPEGPIKELIEEWSNLK